MSRRYEAVDALRGLIMMIMAIDHASAFIARQHSSEFWAGAMSAYSSAFPFLTRWITHLCAPGFFFLLGAGVFWFAESRRKAGWTDGAIARRIALRGLAIFLVAQLFEAPIIFLQDQLAPAAVRLNRITAPPPNDGSALWWGLITLSGLGLVMMACAALLRLRPWMWLGAAALSVFATNTLLPASGKPGPLWQAVLLAPGLSQHVFVAYPAIPWLAAAAAGLYFAREWHARPERSERLALAAGLGLLALGIALRAAGGWGNIRPPRYDGWIEFLNNVKYPPSLVFLAMSIGIDLLLLFALLRAPEAWKRDRSPLIVFGQTPLFFYLAHFYALMAAGFLFFRTAAPLEWIYPVWAAVLLALYPACIWYRGFKMSKPAESLWRMF